MYFGILTFWSSRICQKWMIFLDKIMQYDVTWPTWQLSHINLYVIRSDIFVNTLLSVLSNLYFKDFLWFLLNHSIPVLHPDSPVWLRLSDRIIRVALLGGRQGIFRLNSENSKTITKMITRVNPQILTKSPFIWFKRFFSKWLFR